jgi:hypothetical protein
MNGETVEAHMDRHYADTSIGHAALVLDSGTIIEPSFAAVRGITLVEATPDERMTLEAAGYHLPDDDSGG